MTAADRAAENAIRSLIKRNFPEHGIVGEEYGNERADAEYVWVLDPIDGTKSFITGMPAWGSLIALTRNGVPVFGMMHQPFITRALLRRRRRRAVSRAGRASAPLHVRPCASLERRDDVHHQPAAHERGGPRGVRPGRGRREALALRRGLLRLLHAGGGPRRSRDRERA